MISYQTHTRYIIIRTVKSIFSLLIFLLLSFILVGPVIWTFITSIQPEVNMVSSPPRISLADITFLSYTIQLSDSEFVRSIRNSICISLLTTVICVTIAFIAAYPIARIEFKGKRLSFVIILSLRMLPPIVLLVPIFLIYRFLNLLDTYIGLALAYTALQLPFVVWLLSAFLREIPKELERAGRMDGCTRLGVIGRIILPLSTPGLGAISIFSFIGAWREFLTPLVLARMNSQVVSVYVTQFVGMYKIDWTHTASSGIVAVIPGLIIVVVFQKFIIKGLFEGSIKA